MNKLLLLALLILPVLSQSQSRKEKKAIEARLKADREVMVKLKEHVLFLSEGAIHGAKDGTAADELTREYIINEFKNIGLTAPVNSGFIQRFVIEEGRKADSSTHFYLNENKLLLNKDYFPLAYSANKAVTGSPAIDLREAGEPWFTDIKDWLQAEAEQDDKNINGLIRNEVKRAVGKKASALILYNSGPLADQVTFNSKDSSTLASIPVIYLTKEAFKQYCSDRSALLDIDLNVSIKEVNRSASNILGYLDNGAPSTIIIAAHYDHAVKLGDNINVGAVENASGTAALIELARLLKNAPIKMNNYLFIAFADEGSNYLGSRYWMENKSLATPINYMINMDRIGSYAPATKLNVGGAASSGAWLNLLQVANDNSLSLNIDTSMVAQGDHLVFYNNKIPVLYFSTTTQNDLQKTIDDWQKLNFDGQVKIVRYVQRLVENADDRGRIAFAKPGAQQSTNPPRYTVSLGVIPDNRYEGKGFKIGGVTPKRLADKMGLKSGDILLQLGDYEINEMNSYLQALSMFKQGDVTTLKVLRGKDEKRIDVIF